MKTLREMAGAVWDVVLAAMWIVVILMVIGLAQAILTAIGR